MGHYQRRSRPVRRVRVLMVVTTRWSHCATLMFLLGCDSEREIVEHALASVEMESEAAATSVDVPAVSGGNRTAVAAGMRVLVSMDAIVIDKAPSVLARWRGNPDAFFNRTQPGEIANVVPASPARVLGLEAGRINSTHGGGPDTQGRAPNPRSAAHVLRRLLRSRSTTGLSNVARGNTRGLREPPR